MSEIDWDKVFTEDEPRPEVDKETLWDELEKAYLNRKYSRLTYLIGFLICALFFVELALLYTQIGRPYAFFVFAYVFPGTVVKLHHLYLIRKTWRQ